MSSLGNLPFFFLGGGSNSLLTHGFYIFQVFQSIVLIFKSFILYVPWPKSKIRFLSGNTYFCFGSNCPLSHIQLKVMYACLKQRGPGH